MSSILRKSSTRDLSTAAFGHRLLRKLGVALGVTLVSFVAVETTLRVFDFLRPSFIFRSDDYRRFRGTPHARDWDFLLNSRGFKDVEFEISKPPGIFRILGIGDSFAFGVVPYRFNYLTLLEEQLNRNPAEGSEPMTEVVNMGIPYLGPRDYLAILLHEGLETQPDLVLLSVYIGNDFTDTGREPDAPWWLRSYVVRLSKFAFDLQTKFEGTVYRPGEYRDDAPTFDYDHYVSLNLYKNYMYRGESPRFEAELESMVDSLSEIARICERAGIELAVIIIPDELQVNAALQADVIGSTPVSEYDFEEPSVRLREELQEMGVATLDLLMVFQTESRRRPLYKPADSHWNIAGNELAAQRIRGWLEASGLIAGSL